MSRKSQRNRKTRQQNNVPWLVGGVVLLAVLALGGWLWASRNQNLNGAAQPISRLSTNDFHSLAFSPTEPDTVFFGHHGGLLVSRDGGRTWQPTALQNADAMALAAPVADPRVMYAAGHDVFLKSTDGGATWQPVTTNLPGSDIHGFAADPQNAEHVYAHVVGFGIWDSQDGGTIWNLLSPEVPRSTFDLTVGKSSQTLYAAAGEAGLWRSEDGGKTWTPLSSVPGGGVITVTYDSTSRRLYVTTLGNESGLYASDDDGTTWRSLGLKGTLLAISLSPLDPKHILVVDEAGRVYASRDGGTTWGNQ
jgi:photosystem II stability/assembly factor-like uncharacterized protein